MNPQHEEYYYGVADLSDDLTTIVATPCVLKAGYINTTISAHACPIKDDTTSVFTIPSGSLAGDKFDFENTRIETKLIVDPDNSATGSITLMYRPLRDIT